MQNLMSQSYRYSLKYSMKSCRLFSKKTVNFKNNQQFYDMIGPPNPVSNLRPTVFAQLMNETYLEKRYREIRQDTQQWNQAFWLKHNRNFIEERKRFQEIMSAQGKVTLTADEMSLFYKQFLDKNWQSHFNYNISWYKRNIKILFFEIAVKICKIRFNKFL